MCVLVLFTCFLILALLFDQQLFEPCKIWDYSGTNNGEKDANMGLCKVTTENGKNRNVEFGQKNAYTQI